MRWSIGLAVAGAAASAAAKPAYVSNEARTWAKGDVAKLAAADGFVAIALTTRELECAACRTHPMTYARAVTEVDAPGRWHVYVVYADDRVSGGDEILAGAPLPLIALYTDGRLIAARASNASGADAAAWLAKNAARAAKLDGGTPLACAQRLIDLLVAPGHLGAADLARVADLRARHTPPAKADRLAPVWGVLASFEVAPRDRDLELGDLVIDTHSRTPALMIVDRPTAPRMKTVAGTFVSDDGTTSPGTVRLTADGDQAEPPLRDEVIVLRPGGGAFCSP